MTPGLEVWCMDRGLLWRAHARVAWLLRRALAHVDLVGIGMLRLPPHHHVREGHLLRSLHGHGLLLLMLCMLCVYQLLLRRC